MGAAPKLGFGRLSVAAVPPALCCQTAAKARIGSITVSGALSNRSTTFPANKAPEPLRAARRTVQRAFTRAAVPANETPEHVGGGSGPRLMQRQAPDDHRMRNLSQVVHSAPRLGPVQQQLM